MKTYIKHLHHKPSKSLTTLIQHQLDELADRRQIDEAIVFAERRLEASPPFRVRVHLVTPGPDVFADSVDHTLRAALSKAMAQLGANIRRRHSKHMRRIRDRLHAGVRGQLSALAAHS